MRHFLLSVIVLTAFFGSFAQSEQSVSQPSVEVTKHGWEKVRIDWMKDPLTSPTGENFYEMRTRVSTERRPRSAMEERNVSAAREEKQKPTPPPRYVFEYKISIQNNFPKAIRELDWDYIFLDSGTGEILGHREFTSVEKVAPGKRKDLKITISSPPTKRVSVHALGKNEHDGIVDKIVISRIVFEDGSIWQGNLQ